MSMSWETTDDDVLIVLERRLGRRPGDALLERAFDICCEHAVRIEKAALASAASADFENDLENDLEDQTSGAYSEILDILIEEGVVPKEPSDEVHA